VEGRPLDDTESGVVERARRGDIRAYEELVRRYQDVAFRLAYTILGSAEEAEDAAQEGFVRAFHDLNRFRRGAPVRPWLLTIVANAARTRRASAARRPALALQGAESHPSDDSAQSPEVMALVAEQRRELLSADPRRAGDLPLHERTTSRDDGGDRGQLRPRRTESDCMFVEAIPVGGAPLRLAGQTPASRIRDHGDHLSPDRFQ
jgi:hypothetical protein